MELITAGINAVVVSALGLVLVWLGKERFEAHDRRMDRLEESLIGRLHQLDEDLVGRMDRLEGGLVGRMDQLGTRLASEGEGAFARGIRRLNRL